MRMGWWSFWRGDVVVVAVLRRGAFLEKGEVLFVGVGFCLLLRCLYSLCLVDLN